MSQHFKGKLLKKSIFGHLFKKGEVVCAYNALKIDTIYFGRELLQYILSAAETPVQDVLKSVPDNLKKYFIEILIKLCNSHIYVPVEYNELYYLKKVQKMAFNGPHIRSLILHLTDYCNLRCRYCFIEGTIPSGYRRENMSRETMRKALETFARIIRNRYFPKSPSIVFYGGEPLINWPVMAYGLKYIMKLQQAGLMAKDIDKILITNGTLVNSIIADKLAEYDVMVAVSIDGPENIHNCNRIYRNGRGSFNDTLEGYRCLIEAGIKPNISSVLNENGIDNVETIIHWLLDDLGVKTLGFNHVSIIPNLNSYDPIYEADFSNALIKVQEVIQQGYPDVYERRMNHKINAFVDRRILRADCTGCGEQMTVSPDGKIGICQGYMGSRKNFNGSVNDPIYDPVVDPAFIEWSHRSPLNMAACYSCFALSTCGGGCPRNADYINGSIWEIDSAFCHFARRAHEWMIWKKYEYKKRSNQGNSE